MPGRANVYWTSTVADASPDRTTTVTIASIAGVTGLPMARNVILTGTLALTTGADTTGIELSAFSGLGAGVQFGDSISYPIAVAENAIVVPFAFQGTIPVGSGPITLQIDQADASADAAVTALTAYCLVGD